jgi:GT2 family glycosyltransferase
VRRWSLALNSARYTNIAGEIHGANMTARRALVEHIGFFDEDFGPGSRIGSGEDTGYLFRAYLAGITLEHVPDMAVAHYHGRKTVADGNALFRRYMIGSGALHTKFFLKHPNLCRQTYWDVKHVVREILTGTNLFYPRNRIFPLRQTPLHCARRTALFVHAEGWAAPNPLSRANEPNRPS